MNVLSPVSIPVWTPLLCPPLLSPTIVTHRGLWVHVVPLAYVSCPERGLEVVRCTQEAAHHLLLGPGRERIYGHYHVVGKPLVSVLTLVHRELVRCKVLKIYQNIGGNCD